ncbi:acetyltransferase (GNAT) family protein [Flavobacterium tiangeerense]|uniref:Acetyltransferase (GNAT) family protein n=1 Tax=Flavobacterium tiangeerense TaxID=459471 RepID=A0ABY3FJM4_9FLAO|nr:GNAT family N-acetyltransferase [Flavobacterium tiangeerense]TWH99159.1 acetyltransferase (GNAT) family protein [Flavobacterium tiangeerense]
MHTIYNLSTEEGIDKYKFMLSSFCENNPYYLIDYINIFSNSLKNLMCFSLVSEESNSVILMPGYLKPIVIGNETTHYFDFITPYGYSGPFFSENTRDSDINFFWDQVDKWYAENDVVSEFIRFNLSGNQTNYSGKIFPTMLNVKGKIIDKENQWKEFDAKVRKNVKRAERENLSSKVFYINIPKEKVKEFYEIYIQTMNRTNANENFLYTIEQFQIFLNNNKQHAAICTVYFENIPVSSELLLVSKDTIFSFLGGTNELYFDKRPNDFLKVEVLNWARSIDKKYYVLGGGYGFEDGIFKYKKSFFPDDVVPYYTGRKIINNKVYEELVNKLNKVRFSNGLPTLEIEDNTFFPLYNKLD